MSFRVNVNASIVSLSIYRRFLYHTLAKARASLQKFMDSLMQKNGKIRGLIRELKTNYSTNTLMTSLGSQNCAYTSL